MSKFKASKEDILRVRTAMVLRFPNCFAPKGAPKKPLKVGILSDLLSQARADFPELSIRLIRAFMRDYTRGVHYHEAVIKGGARVDLNGSFAGFVRAEDIDFSKQVLSLRKGPKSIGELAVNIVLGVEQKIRLKKSELEELQRQQSFAEMSDSRYFSNGRKAKDDAEISRLSNELRSLEAECQVSA